MGNNEGYKNIIIDRFEKYNNKQEFGTLRILSWNCCFFSQRKGPMLSWIPIEIDIIFIFATWQLEESYVPNMELDVSGFK